MNRRSLIQNAGVVGLAPLVGCLGGPVGDGSPTPGVSESDFEVTGRGPGTATQTASVEFGDPLLVTGTTTGNDGCYTAKLADVSYDHPTLQLVVEAYEPDDAGMCTQSLVTIDYEARVSFSGTGAERVVVAHDSMGEVRQVADVSRSSG